MIGVLKLVACNEMFRLDWHCWPDGLHIGITRRCGSSVSASLYVYAKAQRQQSSIQL